MSTEDKKTDNELIAEFMGLERSAAIWDRDEHAYTIKLQGSPHWNRWTIPSEMLFHKSWDWLMPVVEKISSLDISGSSERSTTMTAFKHNLKRIPIDTPIATVYQFIVEFCKVYTQTQVTWNPQNQ